MRQHAAGRRFRVVVIRIIVDSAFGAAIGVGYWTLTYLQEGIGKAIRGEIDDSLGMLQALVTLGVLVGGLVGLAHGSVEFGHGYVPPSQENHTPATRC